MLRLKKGRVKTVPRDVIAINLEVRNVHYVVIINMGRLKEKIMPLLHAKIVPTDFIMTKLA